MDGSDSADSRLRRFISRGLLCWFSGLTYIGGDILGTALSVPPWAEAGVERHMVRVLRFFRNQGSYICCFHAANPSHACYFGPVSRFQVFFLLSLSLARRPIRLLFCGIHRYDNLRKPWFNPPKWAFPVMWIPLKVLQVYSRLY